MKGETEPQLVEEGEEGETLGAALEGRMLKIRTSFHETPYGNRTLRVDLLLIAKLSLRGMYSWRR